MKKKSVKKFFVYGMLWLFLCCFFESTAWSKTEAYFNKTVDKRFAWLNNDAHGDVDFKAKIIELINSAKQSIDVCTMSFGGVEEIGDALAAAAAEGKQVRIIGNAGHRFGDGYQRALRGPVQIADNNLPALVCRINFQIDGSFVPKGFLPDYGNAYGDRKNGHTYGWEVKSTGNIEKTNSTEYSSSLLSDVFVIQNNKQSAKWSIKLDNGFYYVLVNVGSPDRKTFNYIKVQDQTVFTRPGKFYEYEKKERGEFTCSKVEGGSEKLVSGEVVANSRRVEVKNGKLTITVGGNNSYDSYTAFDFVEIYRASPTHPYGDKNTNKKYVQERQLQHSKYVLIDGGTESPKLWTGSGNLTAAMLSLSEDAILTDEKEICSAFYKEFNHMWGGTQIEPDKENASFGKFKAAISTTTFNIENPYFYPQGKFLWTVHFSPSKLPEINLYKDLSLFINSAQHNLIMLLEQWTPSTNLNDTLCGSTYLMEKDLGSYINSGKPFYGLFGNENPDPIFSYFKGRENAYIKKADKIHNKIALADAYRDTRYAKRGSLLFGSMNWSQSGMHSNDEQTIIVKDPALANQYLQRAMAALSSENMMPASDSDIILVLDRSGSMNSKVIGGTSTKLDAMKSAAKLFLELLSKDGKHRISIVRFGKAVENNKNESAGRLEKLTPQHIQILNDEIDSITAHDQISSWTCYGLALEAALNRFNNVSGHKRRIVVFFTDGQENREPYAETVYPKLVAANVEIHSIAFGAFSPFSSEGPTAVLADMAYASAGSFAQIDEDPINLKKRFAEIAGDIMDASVILDPPYELTKNSPVVKIEIPEVLDSFQVIQLDEADSSISAANLVEPVAAKKSVRLIKKEKSAKGKSYQVVQFKQDKRKIKKYFPEIELRLQEEVSEQYSGKIYVMVLAKAPTTIKAEAVAVKAGEKEITLLCRMLQENQALTNATITAEWTSPVSSGETKITKVNLYDDGKHGDGQASDGLFGVPLTLNTPGNHSFHIVGIASEPSKSLSMQQKIDSKKKELLSFNKEVKLLKDSKDIYIEQKADLKQQKRLLEKEVKQLKNVRKEYQKRRKLLQTQKIRRETTVYYTVNQ